MRLAGQLYAFRFPSFQAHSWPIARPKQSMQLSGQSFQTDTRCCALEQFQRRDPHLGKKGVNITGDEETDPPPFMPLATRLCRFGLSRNNHSIIEFTRAMPILSTTLPTTVINWPPQVEPEPRASLDVAAD